MLASFEGEAVKSDRHGPSACNLLTSKGGVMVAIWSTTAVCAWRWPFREDSVIIVTLVKPKMLPSMCEYVAIVTAPAACQKIFSAFAPQSKSTDLYEADILKVPVVCMMNTSFGPPQKVMSS